MKANRLGSRLLVLLMAFTMVFTTFPVLNADESHAADDNVVAIDMPTTSGSVDSVTITDSSNNAVSGATYRKSGTTTAPVIDVTLPHGFNGSGQMKAVFSRTANASGYPYVTPKDNSWAGVSSGTTYGARTDTYTTTLSGGAGSVTAYVYEGNSKATASKKGTIKINYSVDNALPRRKSGVSATADASMVATETYSLDLSSIFEDPDGDAMTYKVKVNGAAAVTAAEQYTFTTDQMGDYALVFTANDGVADSTQTYTVDLSVSRKPGTWYITNTSGTGYSTAAADGSSSPVDTGGSYTVKLTLGGDYTRGEDFAVKANGTALTEDSAGSNLFTISNITEDQAITVEGVELKKAVINAPAGSTVKIGYESGEWTYYWYDPVKIVDNGDGTAAYQFNPVSNGNSFFRVQNPQGTTYWNFESLTAGKEYTVTMNDLTKNGTLAKGTIYHDFHYNYLDLGDIYLTVNERNYLPLTQGGTKVLNAFRNWNPINSFTNDKIAIPDFHYEVVDIDGNPSDLVTVEPDANNSGRSTIKASSSKSGLAIIKVTYDSLIHMDAYASGYGAGGADTTRFGATWPECTGIIVVSVGSDGSAIDMGMTINTDMPVAHAGKSAGDKIDAEHDLLYYYGEEGAEYTFKPEDGASVSIARCTVGETALSYNGFTTSGVTTDDEGNVTVKGLTSGRHIVKVEKDGVANYQVLSARKITIKAENADGDTVADWDSKVFAPGDTVKLTLHNVNSPQEKLAQCYNNSFTIAYFNENGTRMPAQNDGSHGYGQYNFSSLDQVVTVTIPEDWTVKHNYDLRGAVALAGFSGTAAGGHRAKNYGGESGMAQGTSGAGILGKLPDLRLNVNVKPNIKDGVAKTAVAEVDPGNDYELDLSGIFEDANSDALTYTVSVDGGEPQAAAEAYSFPVSEAGIYKLVFRANDGIEQSDDLYTVMIKAAAGNIKPMRKATVPETASAMIGKADNYELDLSTIFEDAEGDALTYKVSVDDADFDAADKDYHFTPAAPGEYKLVFKANDGTDDSDDTYTVNLKVVDGTDPAVYWDSAKDGTGWAGGTATYCYIAKASSSGVYVKDFQWTGNTCNVTLVSDTAQDARFDFKVSKYTRTATQGVYINAQQFSGAPSSTTENTVPVKLTDGQASVTVQPYRTASSLGTLKTFNFTVEPDHTHEWGEPTYEWADDNSTVKAKRVCADPSHVEEETVETTSARTKEPGCTEKGETTYTTKPFTNPAFTEQSKTVANIDATGHDWSAPEWTWNGTESATAKFTCGNVASHVDEVPAVITSAKDGEGHRIYTATAEHEGETFTDTQTKTIERTTAKVDFTSQMSGGFLHAPQTGKEVASDLSEQYGYIDDVDGVSALDVLVAAHELTFGDAFTEETAEDYLKIKNNNVERQFGVDPVEGWMGDTFRGGFFVNHAFPNDGTSQVSPYGWTEWNGTTVGTHEVKDGDLVEFFFFENEMMGDTYTWFTDAEGNYSRNFTQCAGEDLTLVLKGFYAAEGYRCKDEEEFVNFDGAIELADQQLYLVDTETGAKTEIEDAVTDEDGEVTLNFDEAGTYVITAYGEDDSGFVTPIMTLTTITIKEHDWNAGVITTKPTATEDGVRTYTCKNDSSHTKTEVIPAYGEEVVNIDLLAQVDKNTLHDVLYDFEVSSEDADKYGYVKPEAFWGKATMADAAAALHHYMYGEDFDENPQNYLKISSAGTITKIFGEPTMMNGFRVNDKTPEYPDQPGVGSLWNDTPVADGDSVRIFLTHGEYYGMMESYLMFDSTEYSAHEGEGFEAEVTGDLTFGTMMGMPEDVHEIEDATVALVRDYTDPAGTTVAEAVTDEDGVAAFENLAPGEYHLVVTDYENEYGDDCFSTPYAKVTVTAHDWEWEMTKEPTLDEEGLYERTCSICEKHETKVIPKLTEATVNVRLNNEAGEPAKVYKDLYVRSDYAYKGGFAAYDDISTVTMADAIVAAHMEEYGDAYKGSSDESAVDAQFIVTNNWGFPWTIKIFNSTKPSSYWLNNDFAMEGMFDMDVNDNDLVSVQLYETDDYSDTYLYTDEDEYVNDAEGYVEVTLISMQPDDNYEYHPIPVEGAKIVLRGEENESIYEAETDENGVAVFQPDYVGKYTVTVTETPFNDPWLPPVAEAAVAENAHTLAVAKRAAINEVEEYADAHAGQADETKLEAVVVKATKQINNAETEAEIAELVAQAKAKIDDLVDEQTLRNAKAEAAAALRALMEENKDKVLDPDELDLTVLKAIDRVYGAESEDEIDGVVAAANEAVQALVEEKEAADAAAEEAARELAEAKQAALEDLDAIDLSEYPEIVREEMQALIDDAKDAVSGAETKDDLLDIMEAVEESLSKYKTEEELLAEAKEEALALLNEIEPNDFVESDAAAERIEQAKADIDAAQTPDEIDALLEALFEDLDAFETLEDVEDYRDQVLEAIDESFDPEDYVDSTEAERLINEAKAAIEDAKTTDEIAEISGKLLEDLSGLKTVEQEDKETEDARKAAIAQLQKMLDDNANKVLAKDKTKLEVAVLKGIVKVQGAETKAMISDAVSEASGAVKKLTDAKAKVDKQKAAAKKRKVKGLKAKSKKRKFTVRWKKNKNVSGYKLQYKQKGAKKFKTLKASLGKNKTKFVTKKLKKGKKYIFRIRPFTKVNGQKVFGKWSKTKAIKCK